MAAGALRCALDYLQPTDLLTWYDLPPDRADSQSSGVNVDDACLTAFQDLKLGKKYRYVTYCLGADNRKIVVETAAAKDATYADFVKSLPTDDCRYAVFDFEYTKAEGEGVRSKICFIIWAPDTAKVRSKMLYASSKDALRKALVGICTEIQATDASEISYEAVLEKVTAI